MKRFFKKIWLSLVVFFLGGLRSAVYASTPSTGADASSWLDTVNSEVQQSIAGIFTFLQIAAGVAAGVSLLWALLDRRNGQEGANQKALSALIVSVIVFVGLFIIKKIIT